MKAAPEQLRSLVERIERLNAQGEEIKALTKEVYDEGKAEGYDTKALRQVIALRKKSPDEIAEEAAILDMFKAALGMS